MDDYLTKKTTKISSLEILYVYGNYLVNIKCVDYEDITINAT